MSTTTGGGDLVVTGGDPSGVSDTGVWQAGSGTTMHMQDVRTETLPAGAVSAVLWSGVGTFAVEAPASRVTFAHPANPANPQVTAMTVSDGVLAGVVDIAGTFGWTGGAVTSTTHILGGSTLTYNTAGPTGFLDGGSLVVDVNGSANWIGGNWDVRHGGTIDVLGKLTVSSDNATIGSWIDSTLTAGPLTVEAGGQFVRAGGVGLPVTVAMPFANLGTVSTTAGGGGLVFAGGDPSGVTDTGAWLAAPGTTVHWQDRRTIDGSAQSYAPQNLGTIAIDRAGSDILTPPSVSFPSTVPNLAFSAGRIEGALLLVGAGTWTGGVVTASGQLQVGDHAKLTYNSAGTDGVLDGGKLQVNGGATCVWAGNNWDVENGGSIDVAGTFVAAVGGDAAIGPWVSHTAAGALTVESSGVLTRDAATGTATVALNTSIANGGTVELKNGDLTMQGGLSLQAPGFSAYGSILSFVIKSDGAGGSVAAGVLHLPNPTQLAGRLFVASAAGFTPVSGSGGTVIDGTDLTGTFAYVTGPYVPQYVATGPVTAVTATYP